MWKTLATLSASFARCKREDVENNAMWGKGRKISAKRFPACCHRGGKEKCFGKALLQLKMCIQKDWSPSVGCTWFSSCLAHLQYMLAPTHSTFTGIQLPCLSASWEKTDPNIFDQAECCKRKDLLYLFLRLIDRAGAEEIWELLSQSNFISFLRNSGCKLALFVYSYLYLPFSANPRL